METLMNFFRPSARYEGVRPFHIWALRAIYLLAFAFVGTWAWRSLLNHEGPWEQYKSVAICVWAAYTTMLAIGILKPLTMLPVMLFMTFYKTLWLVLVWYPMSKAGTLTPGMDAMAKDFMVLPLALVIIPWGYVWRNYWPLGSPMAPGRAAPASALD
jgi:hypothetical protein